MAKQILDEIQLFLKRKKLLEELLAPYAEVPNVLSTVVEDVSIEPMSATENLFNSGLMSEEDFQSAQSDEGYTSSEILDTGFIYAPYIPLYVSPSVNISDLKTIRFRSLTPTRYKIPKYNDIYSDIKERFELLDL